MCEAPRSIGFAERVALYVCARNRARADELLEGLAPQPLAQATAFAQQVLSWDSATRQARLSREFGARPDALEQLHALVLEAPPALRLAIAQQLPASARSHFAHLRATQPIAPCLAALAARLVREATRCRP